MLYNKRLGKKPLFLDNHVGAFGVGHNLGGGTGGSKKKKMTFFFDSKVASRNPQRGHHTVGVCILPAVCGVSCTLVLPRVGFFCCDVKRGSYFTRGCTHHTAHRTVAPQ